MKIGLDFDGVVLNCAKLKRAGALRLYNISIPEEKFRRQIIVGENILTANQYTELLRQVYETEELRSDMEFVHGFLENLHKLQEDGHEVFIITSRVNNSLTLAKKWIADKGLNLPFYSDKENKLQICLDLGIDVFVDDDLDKLEYLIGHIPNLFLLSWGYNQDIELPKEISRTRDWSNLYNSLKTL